MLPDDDHYDDYISLHASNAFLHKTNQIHSFKDMQKNNSLVFQIRGKVIPQILDHTRTLFKHAIYVIFVIVAVEVV